MGHPDSSSVYSEHDNIAPGGTNTGATMSVRQCSRTARCSARRRPRAARSSDRLSVNIYVNNNIQGVANSVLLGSKVAMQNPGLRLSYQQLGGGDDSDVETEKVGEAERRQGWGVLLMIAFLFCFLFVLIWIWKVKFWWN